MLKGIGASQGFGIGKAVVIRDTNLDYSSVKFTDSDHQKKRLHSAVADFSDETKSLVAELKKNAGNKEAEILEGHLVMLEDPFMLAQMEEAIDNGYNGVYKTHKKAHDKRAEKRIDKYGLYSVH